MADNEILEMDTPFSHGEQGDTVAQQIDKVLGSMSCTKDDVIC
jgi:hypothetical protein